MADSTQHIDPQTVQRFESVACLFEWMGSLPDATRKQAWHALSDCTETKQKAVVTLVGVVKDPATPPDERQQAITTIALTLFPDSNQYGLDLIPSAAANSFQATFARRLRELMESKRLSQQELAERIGCSQPAISQLLNRNSRPQKKTIVKLAEALNVAPGDLWPDIVVSEQLDAVASFQEDGYVMTEAESRALGSSAQPNRPQLDAKLLPSRLRK